MAPVPRSLVWATDIDVLPTDHEVLRRDRYLVVHSPSNPAHWWGNFLLFDEPPDGGDGERWEAAFAAEFGARPGVRHRVFAWDVVDGAEGAADSEFVVRGYARERSVGLIATPDQIRAHPRADRDVTVRALRPDGDAALWGAIVDLQAAERPALVGETEHLEFLRRRQAELRAMFRTGAGAWYAALGTRGEVVGSCGIVVTAGRARYQHVSTAAEHRRRGICSRLLVDAAAHAIEHFTAESFVIAADPEYHALGLYESLGFTASERVCGVLLPPPGDSA
ncbi:MAG TPA: GNAT family N-acetyltransferase [Solirubrobacteraceae bacterium]|nr:GNAT family N-acetyltransferase [Solirubrobacteraceae bacterium]